MQLKTEAFSESNSLKTAGDIYVDWINVHVRIHSWTSETCMILHAYLIILLGIHATLSYGMSTEDVFILHMRPSTHTAGGIRGQINYHSNHSYRRPLCLARNEVQSTTLTHKVLQLYISLMWKDVVMTSVNPCCAIMRKYTHLRLHYMYNTYIIYIISLLKYCMYSYNNTCITTTQC